MFRKVLIVFLSSLSFNAFASKDVVDTSIQMLCTTGGFYADGQKIIGTGVEKISIEVKRINFRKDEPAKPPLWGSMSNIKVTSGSRQTEANLIKSEKNRIAFAYSNDVSIDEDSKSELYIYEIRLDNMKSKKSVISLFSKNSNSMTVYEGVCKKQ